MSATSSRTAAFRSLNPATGEPLEAFEETSREELEALLARAERGFRQWSGLPLATRAGLVKALGERLKAGREKYARSIALEVGKPISQGLKELDTCAAQCAYYAANAERFLSAQRCDTEAAESYCRFDPLGPLLAILSWNSPFVQAIRFAAPALAAGNTVVLKHAPNVQRCALQLEEAFREAGFPEGVFTNVRVPNEGVGALIDDRRLRAVMFTGSVSAGMKVAERAGRALKKTVLELGGSNPLIVFDDADIAKAAKKGAESRLANCGQSCMSTKRFIVLEGVLDRFLEAFVGEMRARKVGDPLQPQTEVGPMARGDLRQALHAQVQQSLQRGARLALGGVVPEGPGSFYPPTVLTGVAKGMAVFDEETFGPAAAVISARSEEHALELANDSPYGLGACLWTRDKARAQRLIPLLEAGRTFVNEVGRSDPGLPSGGIKWSGHGRQLAEYGMREFVNVKSVWAA